MLDPISWKLDLVGYLLLPSSDSSALGTQQIGSTIKDHLWKVLNLDKTLSGSDQDERAGWPGWPEDILLQPSSLQGTDSFEGHSPFAGLVVTYLSGDF